MWSRAISSEIFCSMNVLMHKMAAIEATGILGIDLSWPNANYQRAMFHTSANARRIGVSLHPGGWQR